MVIFFFIFCIVIFKMLIVINAHNIVSNVIEFYMIYSHMKKI